MALTTEKSIQVSNAAAGIANDSADYKGSLVPFKVDFTQGAAAGDTASTADLMELPPGKWRYIQDLSKLFHSALGTGRLLDIGHTGYTEPDGDVIAADVDAIDSLHDVAAAGSYAPGDELTVDGTLVINSRTKVLIQGRVTVTSLPAGATIKGILMFMRG